MDSFNFGELEIYRNLLNAQIIRIQIFRFNELHFDNMGAYLNSEDTSQWHGGDTVPHPTWDSNKLFLKRVQTLYSELFGVRV